MSLHIGDYKKDTEPQGPPRAFGYNGQYQPWNATPSEWRAFWMRQARRLGTHTAAEWFTLRDSAGCCMGCGSTDRPLTKDHIIPVSRGGCDCLQNLQPLCKPCNSSKCDRIEGNAA
jgi:5-methylcytosine-specific restriction endonuclease McrA